MMNTPFQQQDIRQWLPKSQFIAGNWAKGSSGSVQKVIDPATGDVIVELALASEADVDRAVDAAREAFVTWRHKTAADRAEHLLRLADAIDVKAAELAYCEALNVGKPYRNALAEIGEATDCLRFYAGAARVAEGTFTEQRGQSTSIVRREPVGVAGLILAWNFPFMSVAYKIGPALAAGNCCVVKPSEMTPLTALMLGEIAAPVLPPGVLNIITGDGQSAGQRLVTHPDVALVSLTGDVSTGKLVARECATSLKRLCLELGGNAPVLIFADADLDAAASTLARSSFVNSGQVCLASTRLLVEESVKSAFIERLISSVSALKVGAQFVDGTDLGPLVSETHFNKVAGLIERAASDGTVVFGGHRIGERGYFLEPTIITDVEQTSEIVQTEIFGPVVTVQSFQSEEEAFSLANDVPYGLAASVWSRNSSLTMRAARELQFGTVWINEHLATTPATPSGGFKQSGYGKEGSILSLDDYSQFKHIWTRYRD